MIAYDGYKSYQMAQGDYCIARKNHLVRYTKHKENGLFEKIIIVFDEVFLMRFLERHPQVLGDNPNKDSFLLLKEDGLLKNYISSLEPYYNGSEQIDDFFVDIKREELLMILIKNDPRLINVLFNFGIPQKIDLEEFMNRNFRFNISLERFAFLTGRSLSTFKRDFLKTFGTTPGIWLTRKRLDEAYFLIHQQHHKPSEIYMDLGFEDLSHFSFAFKKQFGKAPSELLLKA